MVVTWSAANPVVVGSNPGGRNILATKKFFLNFFQISFFLGVFKWFCPYKKVSLATLAASARPRGVGHGLSRAQGGLQNCPFWPILANLEGFGAKK